MEGPATQNLGVRSWVKLRNGTRAVLTSTSHDGILFYGIRHEGDKKKFTAWWGDGTYLNRETPRELDIISPSVDPVTEVVEAHIPQYSC